MVQAQQKKIDELMEQSQRLMKTVTIGQYTEGWQEKCKTIDLQKIQEVVQNFQSWVYHNKEMNLALESNKDKQPQWYMRKIENEVKEGGIK